VNAAVFLLAAAGVFTLLGAAWYEYAYRRQRHRIGTCCERCDEEAREYIRRRDAVLREVDA
jgi:hypothetical protein